MSLLMLTTLRSGLAPQGPILHVLWANAFHYLAYHNRTRTCLMSRDNSPHGESKVSVQRPAFQNFTNARQTDPQRQARVRRTGL